MTDPVTEYYSGADLGIPNFVWAAVITIPLLSSLYIFSQIFDYKSKIGFRTVILIASICISAIFILFHFPEIRGFALYGRGGADVLSHLGQVRTILETGHIDDENWYPVSHVLLSVLVVLGTPLDYAPTLISIVFSSLNSIFIALYFRSYAPSEKREEYTVIAFTVSFIILYMTFQRSFHPAILSFVFVPLVFHLLERDFFNPSRKWGLLLLVIYVFLLPFHPSTFVILGSIICAFIITVIILRRADRKSHHRIPFPILALVGVGFYYWYFRFDKTFELVIFAVMSALGIREDVKGEGPKAVEAASGMEVTDLIIRSVELYGVAIILTLTATISLAVIIWRIINTPNHRLSDIHLLIQFMFASLFGVIFLVYPVLGSNLIRVLRYYILTAALLTILCLLILRYDLPGSIKSTETVRYAAVVIIIIAVIAAYPISFYGLYNSDNHLPESERTGTDWYLSTYDKDADTYSTQMTYKMEYYLQGVHKVDRSQGAFRRFGVAVAETPPNIGYGNNSKAIDTFGAESYIIVKKSDFDSELTQNDLRKLNNDVSGKKPYSNGDYNVWLT